MKHLFLIGTVWFFCVSGISFAEKPVVVSFSQLTESYLNKTPIMSLSYNHSIGKAMKDQGKFVGRLISDLGPVVGYKAGLTNPAMQRRFGVSQPVRGILLKNMLLQDGATLPADFGAFPMYEGDLIARVGSDEINNAATDSEVLASIDAVIPFIELPDRLFAKDVNVNASMIALLNVGARYGVLGEPVSITSAKEWARRLVNLEVEVFDGHGAKVASGKGNSLLGGPLNVIMWLKDSLKAEGKRLKEGDLLSLGSLTGMMPVKAGSVIRAVYKGLDPRGPVEVSVSFE